MGGISTRDLDFSVTFRITRVVRFHCGNRQPVKMIKATNVGDFAALGRNNILSLPDICNLLSLSLNNNSPNYLAQFFISHQSHYTNSRNNLYVPRPRLDLFKTSISFAGASLWNSLPQNIKLCIFVRCFERNLHKLLFRNAKCWPFVRSC